MTDVFTHPHCLTILISPNGPILTLCHAQYNLLLFNIFLGVVLLMCVCVCFKSDMLNPFGVTHRLLIESEQFVPCGPVTIYAPVCFHLEINLTVNHCLCNYDDEK